ncbi:MAG TPA: VanZ family protein [Ignavibacteriales bacterium]|nr:VanZ family protein [Ignavibacteriales bacterium]
MDYKIVSGAVTGATVLLLGLIWLGIAAFFLVRKRKTPGYVLLFTIFYIYLYKVLDYTLFEFQSLLIIKHFVPGLMLKGLKAGESLNLIPLVRLTPGDIKTSLLNVLLMLPFGFGLPFITNFRMKRVVAAGMLFSIAIEFLQLITGSMAGMTFRVADINDVIFNTAGAAAGYILFAAFLRIYRRAFRNWEVGSMPVLQYIAERPQVDE